MQTAVIGPTLGHPSRIYVRAPYIQIFIEQVKELPERRWHPLAKVWSVPLYLESELYTLAARYYDPILPGAALDVEAEAHSSQQQRNRAAPPTPPASALGEPCATLFVLPSAPLAVCEAAFRALVKQHHPDVGGDTAQMQTLNAAIGEIRRIKKS